MALSLSPLIRFGTSTWTYEGWQGQVYKRQYGKSTFARECLGEYCQYQYEGEPLFRTVGNDSTFYRPPTANQLRTNKMGRESCLREFGQCKNAPYGIVNSLRPARMLCYVSTCDVVRFRCDDTSITRNKDYRPLFFPHKSSHGIWVPSWGRSIPHVCSMHVAALLMP